MVSLVTSNHSTTTALASWQASAPPVLATEAQSHRAIRFDARRSGAWPLSGPAPQAHASNRTSGVRADSVIRSSLWLCVSGPNFVDVVAASQIVGLLCAERGERFVPEDIQAGEHTDRGDE